MKDLFNNKKELFIGKRIFTCDFSVDEKNKKKEDRNANEEGNSCNYDKINNHENIIQNESDEENVDKNLKMYLFNQDIKIKIGTIRYMGNLNNQFPNKIFYGIEWSKKLCGKNMGNYKDHYYFLPVDFLKKEKTKLYYYKLNSDINTNNKYNEEILNRYKDLTRCSFLSIENVYVGITFIQALKFRYNYYPELDLSIEDYLTKKKKKIILSGEKKIMNYFKNYSQLENITLNKYLIYECGIINNLLFNNLQSLSLCGNLFSRWIDIFKIINIASKLSYINISDNKFMNISLDSIFVKNLSNNYNIDNNDKKCNNNNNDNDDKDDDLIYFEQIKEVCLDNTLIEWNDILILSFIFPNLEVLSLKKNYLTNIKIKNLKITKNCILYKYLTNKTYNKLFNTNTKKHYYDVLRDLNENVNERTFYNTEMKHDIIYLNKSNFDINKVGQLKRTNFYESENIKENNKVEFNDQKKDFNEINENFCEKKYLNYNISNNKIDVFTNNDERIFYYSTDLFKNLRKIVLNDNYLYDYEELFYFVYKVSSLQSIYLNNNKYSDNNKLIDIAYNICQDENNKIEDNYLDKFEFINTKFNNLKEFLFDNNEIKNYETLRDLFYIFYDLEILKIQNKKNNFKEKNNMRYIYISILPKLKILNHSSINKNERINSERFFISLYQKDSVAKIFNEMVLNRRHSSRLEKIHYEATQGEINNEMKKCIQNNLINITIIPEFLNSQKYNIIKKKVNKYMNIKDLKYLCSRLYSIPLSKLQLFYTDENSPLCIEIFDTNASLYTYGIENDSKIKIKMEE
ncbi:cytoskeleton associated protein, putative [Plasmodium gallinaceum]|uniref:Cytoskeleton associated protein, putative n=1 Tax=Plasmodium gallinaceum TaxID=5849 RepID=A0A1J1GZL0_PLAGA|nr:cytoskeleton associated protein, putative [Plasmodium gallinaceum]CRG98046.1 cytoskeleton associated protein, putative [Plasmodium gallinaceum]